MTLTPEEIVIIRRALALYAEDNPSGLDHKFKQLDLPTENLIITGRVWIVMHDYDRAHDTFASVYASYRMACAAVREIVLERLNEIADGQELPDEGLRDLQIFLERETDISQYGDQLTLVLTAYEEYFENEHLWIVASELTG